MPRVTDVVTSDSEVDRPRAKHKKEYSSKKNRVTVSSSEPDPASENEEATGEEGDEQDEEYEIEDVIESQKGYFGDGKYGYFVKWKGYPSEDNSWVHEDDAANAQDLITKYWESKRKASKGGPRKSTEAGKLKSGRKSAIAEDTRDPTPPAKKRSRPKKADQEQSEREQDASSDDDDARAKKKPRKSQGTSAKKVTKQLAEDEEIVTFGSMKKHMTIASWENLVETIDTIERGEEGDLYVYFKIKHSDERMRENSRLCAQKFPQKLIKFYESNLRWRIDGEDAN